MEHTCTSTGAIPEGEWISHSLSGMYMADKEADYMMIQLLGNCPTISDVAIPDAFWPRHEESTSMDIPGNYESPDYSLETTNFNFYGISQGTSLFPTSSNQFYNMSDSHPTKNVRSNDNSMSTGFCAGEAKNTTSSYFIEGEGEKHHQLVEESGSNQREEPTRRHEKSNTSSEINSMKKPKISENDQMNMRSRKSKRSCNNEEDGNHMASQLQLNGGMSPNNEAAALNLNRKSRLPRGSATNAQSLYARRRREKINERLRVLQNLVPNGTKKQSQTDPYIYIRLRRTFQQEKETLLADFKKVDISTMLEEAVTYVKFLQLQIKMLSSDDLWMYSPVCYNGMLFGHDRSPRAYVKPMLER